jgi:hypothetical protein
MADDGIKGEQMRELIAKIDLEQDHNKFTALVQELNRLLDADQPSRERPKSTSK